MNVIVVDEWLLYFVQSRPSFAATEAEPAARAGQAVFQPNHTNGYGGKKGRL